MKRSTIIRISVLLLIGCLTVVTRINKPDRANIPNIRLLPRTWDPAFSIPLSSSTKVIVVVALFRSGSTFLGELFNQNPDLLYDFESFHWLALQERKKKGYIIGGQPRHTDDELNLLNLQQIFSNCSILSPLFADVAHKYWQCGRNPQENMELFGSETCSDNSWSLKTIQGIRQYHCRKRKGVALKLIRLRRIRDLELIKNIDQTDVRVIHLLRDPRALLHSRKGFKNIFETKRNKLNWVIEEKLAKVGIEAHAECEDYMTDIAYARNSPWLSRRYIQIRHDDVSIDTEKTAEKIYNFIGLDMPDTVRSYVNGTGTRDTGNNKYFKESAGGVEWLDTMKNSEEVLQNWKKWNEKKTIKQIDKHCARFIKLLNWPFLYSAETDYLKVDSH